MESLTDDIPAVILAALEAQVPEDETAAPTVAGLFATAQDALDDATSAGTSAFDAVKAAGEANEELGTLKAAGESMTEFTNAQAIIDAKVAVAEAVMDAQAALDSANEAKTAAEGLDGDNEHKSALIAALDAAIMVAEEQLGAATESRDSDDLKAAVDAVTGGDDADPQGTPTSRARAVAMAVGAALGGMTTDAAIARDAAIGAEVPGDAVMNAVRMDDHQGNTWAELVGEANIKHERLGTDNARVMVASVAGMSAAMVNDSDLSSTGGTDEDGKYADLFTTTTDSTYEGIPGDVYCLGTDCEVDSDSKLKGSWYFTPDEATAFYVKNPSEQEGVAEMTPYVPETMYAQFGHWLTVDAGDVIIHRYAKVGATEGTEAVTSGLSFDKAPDMPDMPDSATYNGDAAGMSVHKTLGPDGEITSIYSGAFMADAELILRFGSGTDVTLGGTIDGFEGNAIDERWTVELERKAFTDGMFTGEPATGKTVADGRDGEWSATAYGAAGARPTGIFGGFNAHFSDGHAAGAYATR